MNTNYGHHFHSSAHCVTLPSDRQKGTFSPGSGLLYPPGDEWNGGGTQRPKPFCPPIGMEARGWAFPSPTRGALSRSPPSTLPLAVNCLKDERSQPQNSFLNPKNLLGLPTIKHFNEGQRPRSPQGPLLTWMQEPSKGAPMFPSTWCGGRM